MSGLLTLKPSFLRPHSGLFTKPRKRFDVGSIYGQSNLDTPVKPRFFSIISNTCFQIDLDIGNPNMNASVERYKT